MSMDQNSAAFAYNQSSARGASPVGQVVALYDTILRDFRRALAAVDANNPEMRTFEMNHALTVIGELQGVLDFERGGDAAKALERFYSVTRPMILDANVRASRDAILKLIDLYQGVRQAWQEAERKLPLDLPGRASVPATGAAAATAVFAMPPAAPEPNFLTDTPRGKWSA